MRSDPSSHDRSRVRIPIVGLPCVAGGRIPLERALASIAGVAEAYVNAADECVYLDVDGRDFPIEEALATVESFGARGLTPTMWSD